MRPASIGSPSSACAAGYAPARLRICGSELPLEGVDLRTEHVPAAIDHACHGGPYLVCILVEMQVHERNAQMAHATLEGAGAGSSR